MEHRFRCGDTARIEGTDYDIEIAYADYVVGRASWCGWPEGCVDISKLTLVQACSDEEHAQAVARWMNSSGNKDGGGRDHRRDVIHRLYRPRSYWRGVIKITQERLEAEQRSLRHAEEMLREAHSGPLDA